LNREQPAPSWSRGERDLYQEQLRQDLSAASDGFLRSFEGTPADRWLFSPAAGVWSVGETAEHTAAAFRGIQRLLTTRLLEQPMPSGASSPTSDEFIVRAMGRWTTQADLVAAFTESRDQLFDWLAQITVDLRRYSSRHLILGELDGVQWLIFAAAHTERHTRQILEFRKEVGF
jgi:hypothetical protein